MDQSTITDTFDTYQYSKRGLLGVSEMVARSKCGLAPGYIMEKLGDLATIKVTRSFPKWRN